MRENVVKFKLPTIDRLYDRANALCDEGDYASALSSLWYAAERESDNADIYAHIADIYTELGLYDNAVYCWFLFMNKSRKKDYIDGYNGLGANFYFLGNKAMAGYYFNKQLKCGYDTECVYQDVLEDYIDELSDDVKDSYRVVYPESREEIDGKKIDDAEDLNEKQDYIAAVDVLKTVGKDSPLYPEAVSVTARSEYYLNRPEAALEHIREAIALGEKDAENYFFELEVLANMGKEDEFYAVYETFKNEKYDEIADMYKKLNMMCDFGFEDDALKVADDILTVEPNDANTIYIKGLLLHNKGDDESAESYLHKSYLYSRSPIAHYFLREIRHGNKTRFPIGFDLPTDEIERRVGLIKNILSGEIAPEKIDYDDVSDIAEWVYGGNSQSLQIAVSIVLTRANDEDALEYVAEKLVSPMLSDDVKHRMLSMLCESGYNREVGVVYGNVFRKIRIPVAAFGDKGKDAFTKAFAIAFGRLTLTGHESFGKLSVGAEELQKELIYAGNADKVFELSALACAIYLYSGLKILTGKSDDNSVAYDLFGVKKEDVVKILKMTEKQ